MKFNQKLLFSCKVCGKEGRAQRLSEIRVNGNYCSHECYNKSVYLDPLVRKLRRNEWARNYAKQPKIRQKIREYLKEKRRPIVEANKLARLKAKAEKRESIRLVQEQRKQAEITRKTLTCIQCGNSFFNRLGNRERKYCSYKCRGNSYPHLSKKEQNKRYKKLHPEKKSKNKGVSKEIFDKMREGCDYTCKDCGQKEPFENQYWKYLTQDHIIPRSRGGAKRSKDNIQPLCWDCNLKKSNKLDDERSQIQ